LLIAGKLNDPHFAYKPMAIGKSTAIREQWDFFNHEEDEFSRMVSGKREGSFKPIMGATRRLGGRSVDCRKAERRV
jgi:hypothetical protein